MSKKMCLPIYVKTILILVVLLQLCFNGVVQFGNSTRLLKQNFDVDVKNRKGTEANVKHGHLPLEMKSSRSPRSGPNPPSYIPPKKIKANVKHGSGPNIPGPPKKIKY